MNEKRGEQKVVPISYINLLFPYMHSLFCYRLLVSSFSVAWFVHSVWLSEDCLIKVEIQVNECTTMDENCLSYIV